VGDTVTMDQKNGQSRKIAVVIKLNSKYHVGSGDQAEMTSTIFITIFT
jgi:hypothetical protein